MGPELGRNGISSLAEGAVLAAPKPEPGVGPSYCLSGGELKHWGMKGLAQGQTKNLGQRRPRVSWVPAQCQLLGPWLTSQRSRAGDLGSIPALDSPLSVRDGNHEVRARRDYELKPRGAWGPVNEPPRLDLAHDIRARSLAPGGSPPRSSRGQELMFQGVSEGRVLPTNPSTPFLSAL